MLQVSAVYERHCALCFLAVRAFFRAASRTLLPPLGLDGFSHKLTAVIWDRDECVRFRGQKVTVPGDGGMTYAGTAL